MHAVKASMDVMKSGKVVLADEVLGEIRQILDGMHVR
jgi:hypothetical protein